MVRKTQKKITKQILVFVGLVIKDGAVLMTQRYEPECKEAHMKWELPGGKAIPGETPQMAIARELFEETGIQVKVDTLVPYIHMHNWEYEWGTQQTFLVCYVCSFIKEGTVKPDHHVYRFDWISLANVSTLETLSGTAEFINLYANT